MTRFLAFFSNWHGPDREPLPDYKAHQWISPKDAIALLESARSETPMPHRQFLAWRARSGSLPSISTVVYEDIDEESVAYKNIVLSEEWQLPEWQSTHAELWDLAQMRMSKVEGSYLVRRRFSGIAFGRREIEDVAALYPRDEQPCLEKTVDISVPAVRWTETEMTAAILASKFTDREQAWLKHFKGRSVEHGWKATSFRNHWSIARGTRGVRGRPVK